MKKRFSLSFLVFLIAFSAFSQQKRIKNVILMIPDGTSLATVSSARWIQRYTNPDKPTLNIDPYICGTVLTYCSNAPIGDSAPTTSCYMTGVPSLAGWVSTYPIADKKNDIVPLDETKAYQPLMTVLEAARITQNKSTGLVFTCEFPHATPADCSAHSYNRSKYDWIAPQMAHNGLDVVIGGGASILNDESKEYLKKEGYGVFLNDMQNFRTFKGNKMWSLFADKDMSYDIDRDTTKQPSLSEMTQVAIQKLSQNKNGFFLMVEGSKIDWGAHANDPVAMISDMLAFDKACGIAIDFAKKNGETVIVILPDHGNSGISIGSNKCKNYSELTQDQLFKNVSQYKITAEGLFQKMRNAESSQIRNLFRQYAGIELTDDEYKEIMSCGDYLKSELSDTERMKGTKLNKVIANIMDSRTCFGFTTTGHTGEEVFLAVYDPTANRPTGFKTNIQINEYLAKSSGLTTPLTSLTQEYFAKHSDVFKGLNPQITKNETSAVLEVATAKGKLEVRPNTNIVKLNGKEMKLNTIIVYVDKNNTFYLPKSLRKLVAAN